MAITLISFLLFTGLVAGLTWYITKNDDHSSSQGYFLAGRSLTFPLIAGSLLLTNLSTEQLVGLNGGAYVDGFSIMVWEIASVIGMVFMAWFFLPRFLKSGVATVPEFLELRFDRSTQVISNIIFLLAYVVILLPMILFTGATGMIGMLNVEELLGSLPAQLGLSPRTTALWLIIWMVGILGSIYALYGGLRTVAVSDTLNGVGLLVGGLLITWFGLSALGGEGGFSNGVTELFEGQKERFNSIGGPDSGVPFDTIFSGVLIIVCFYWTTNQQIIQRTLGAKDLAEGQKGVLLTGALKLLGPIYLVIPGMIAYGLFGSQEEDSNRVYGQLVREVLPKPLIGFFAAVVIGAILSSFNSALNSACTLFSLGIYKKTLHKDADDKAVVRSGVLFGLVVAIAAMLIAPLLDKMERIFQYLQTMNAIYFTPIFSVVLIGLLTKRVPAKAANFGLIGGVAIIFCGYYVWPFSLIAAQVHTFHFVGIVFAWLIIIMLVIGEISPRETEWIQEDAKAVDLTPWKYSIPAGILLIIGILAIYATFADFSVLELKD